MPSRCKYRNTLVLVSLALVAACGGPTSNNPPGGNATFTATIDGQSWASTELAAQGVIANNAIFSLVGISTGSSPTSISLVLYYTGAPGTYPLGVTGTTPGGMAIVGAGTASWATPLSGAAGSVTISSVSNTRIAGTFNYTAVPSVAGATGNRVVTNGQFDVPVTGTGSTTVADHLGSKFGGTLGGSPWNAASVVTVSHPSSGTMTIGAGNTDYSINLIMSGFTGPGSYPMGTGVVRQVTVTRITGGNVTWGGSNATTGGTLTVTSYASTRVKGTYNIILQPGVVSPGPGTLTIAGEFDVGLQ